MTPIFRWSGAHFGFLTDDGFLYDAAGQPVAWVEDGKDVWDLRATYLGELVGAYYVLRATERPVPLRWEVPAAPPAPAALPPRPADRAPHDPRPGYVDALDAFP